MAIIFRLLRYPRARALAAWMSELVPSSKPLLMRLACQEMIPSQCSSTARGRVESGHGRALATVFGEVEVHRPLQESRTRIRSDRDPSVALSATAC
jgi:hypothetical protein